MDLGQARKWLVTASLSLTGFTFLFCILAPALRYPLEFAQSFRLLEIVTPVFLGYLGSASLFIFNTQRPESTAQQSLSPLLGLLVRGPVLVYFLTILAALIAFGVSNGRSAPPGSGMDVDQLAFAFSAALGLLTATTSLSATYLFTAGSREES